MFEDTVIISGKCFNLFNETRNRYEDLVCCFFDIEDYRCTITSANDGNHSKNSLHYKCKALDLRIKDLPINDWVDKKILETIVVKLAKEFVDFVFILHLYDGKNHLHIQHGRDNIISFDSAIGENKNVFIK